MEGSSFQSRFGEFQHRVQQVRIANALCRDNHIVQCTIRACWVHIFQGGLTFSGHIEKPDIDLVYLPFVKDAVRSLITVGYFAFVVDKHTQKIRVLDSSTYVIVPVDSLFMCPTGDKEKQHLPFHVVFLDQDDCDSYRTRPPKLIVQYEPTKKGNLTCPCMSVIDMHDAIIEFTRLALLNDAINMRPKAWASKKDTPSMQGVYSFLSPEDHISSNMSDTIHAAKNRKGVEKYLREQNSMRQQVIQADKRPFSDTLISRQVQIDAVNDPSILVEVAPNMDLTAMPQTHTRNDLVHLIELFDRRMCNALGIPTILLGIAVTGISKMDLAYSMNIWQELVKTYRDLINIAFVFAIDMYLKPLHKLQYKKTRKAQWLYPLSLSLGPVIDKDTLMELQPFLTPAAFAERMSSVTGLKPNDFQLSPVAPGHITTQKSHGI